MAHYRELADASSLPLIVYNFPARATGFTLPELVELLSYPNIIGIKHTSSDMFQLERIRHAAPDAIVYNGYDEMCLAGLAMGAQGAIGTTYNFMGDVFAALRTCAAEGRIEEARRLQAMANRVIQVLMKVGVMPGSKALLGIMGVTAGHHGVPFVRSRRPISPSFGEPSRPSWPGVKTARWDLPLNCLSHREQRHSSRAPTQFCGSILLKARGKEPRIAGLSRTGWWSPLPACGATSAHVR